MNGIKNGIKRDPKRFFDFANYKKKTVGYPSSIRNDNSVTDCPADICELFADLFESVYNVMMILVAQILKMCLAHPMVVVRDIFI
jgi:hypothetical protein